MKVYLNCILIEQESDAQQKDFVIQNENIWKELKNQFLNIQCTLSCTLACNNIIIKKW